MTRDDAERRDGAKYSRGGRDDASSPHHRSRSRSNSRSRDRGGRHRHGDSPRRSRRSPSPQRQFRGHRSRSRSRDRDMMPYRRRHRRSRSASSGSEYGGYVPRHRRPTGSLMRDKDNGRGKAGVSIHDPLGLTKKQELQVANRKVSINDLPTAAAEVDPAVVQAQRQKQAQQWVLQQQAAAFTGIYEQGDDGLGRGNKKNKEIYVGNLLAGVVTADTLKQLFDSSLSIAFPNEENPLVKPVVHVQMASDMKYAFIQLQTEEMASAAIQLNGMELCGRHMTIARPSGWVDPSLAAAVAAKAAKLLLLEKERGVSAAVVPATVPSMVAPAPTPAVPQR